MVRIDDVASAAEPRVAADGAAPGRMLAAEHTTLADKWMRYWVESEDLWSANDAGVVWRGRPDGHKAEFVVPLPGTDDAVVLLSAESGPRNPLGQLKKWPNLVRVRPDGTVVWRASPERGSGEGDWWVSVHIEADALYANTWSCYRCQLDQESGAAVSSVFTK